MRLVCKLRGGDTYLLVSASAAAKVEYFPPVPTVIAPDGGDEAHNTLEMSAEIVTRAEKRENIREI